MVRVIGAAAATECPDSQAMVQVGVLSSTLPGRAGPPFCLRASMTLLRWLRRLRGHRRGDWLLRYPLPAAGLWRQSAKFWPPHRLRNSSTSSLSRLFALPNSAPSAILVSSPPPGTPVCRHRGESSLFTEPSTGRHLFSEARPPSPQHHQHRRRQRHHLAPHLPSALSLRPVRIPRAPLNPDSTTREAPPLRHASCSAHIRRAPPSWTR